MVIKKFYFPKFHWFMRNPKNNLYILERNNELFLKRLAKFIRKFTDKKHPKITALSLNSLNLELLRKKIDPMVWVAYSPRENNSLGNWEIEIDLDEF